MAIATFTVEQDGAAINADSLPTAVCRVAGADTADVVTVTNLAAGEYGATVAETATDGQRVEIVVSATVGGATQKQVVYSEVYASTPTAALASYDPPTKADLDSAVSPLATAAAVGAIKAKTDTLGAIAATVSNPTVLNSELILYRGDDYSGSRVATLTVPSTATHNDWTGATMAMRVAIRAEYDAADSAGATIGTVTHNITTAGGTVSIALTAAETAGLTGSTGALNYVYQIVATTSAGKDETVSQGALMVARDV